MKKTLILPIAALAVFASIGVVSANKFGFDADQKEIIKAAIIADEYSSLTSDIQEKISEEKFTKIVERHTQREAVKASIEEKDYAAFQAVAGDKMLEKVNSAEAFTALVERKAKAQEHKAALTQVIAENDFDGFKTLVEAHKAQKDSERPDDAPERPEISEEEKTQKLQDKFTKLTQYYAENGELPNKKMRKKAKFSKRSKGDNHKQK